MGSLHPQANLLLPLILTLFTSVLPASALAQAYKCVSNGATTYSQIPCSSGTSQPLVVPTDNPSPDEYQQAQKKNAKDKIALQKLENTRHKNEAKYERELKTAALKNANKKQKCEALQLKVNWAKEDLANTQPRGESKAKLKLKRAGEQRDLNCKTY